MPSLLVTRKMRPELRARVQASVDGRRALPGTKLAPRIMSVMRISLFTLMAALLAWLAIYMRATARQLDRERAALLERVRKQSADLTPDELDAPNRVVALLPLFAGSYEGDLISDELRGNGAFASVIARPTVYVRAPIASFNVGAKLTDNAAIAMKDAFVLCLLEPPAERTEKLLRSKARAGFTGGGARMQSTAHVEPLYTALVGMPFLSPEWEARVRAADDREVLEKLRKNFERAPIDGAKRAARATQLLIVADEPADKAGPSELDGERPHDIRVGLVDIPTKKVLLRVRRRVDPSWVSAATRAEFASGIDSCSLALDVHAAVQNGREVAHGD